MISSLAIQNHGQPQLVFDPDKFPAFCMFAEMLIDSNGNLEADLVLALLTKLETALQSIATSMDATSPTIRENARQQLSESARVSQVIRTAISFLAGNTTDPNYCFARTISCPLQGCPPD